jgi:hypothetical protein
MAQGVLSFKYEEEKKTGMTALAGLPQVQGQENRFIRLMRTSLLLLRQLNMTIKSAQCPYFL